MDGFWIQNQITKDKTLQEILEYAGLCHVENIINEIEDENMFSEEIPFPPELDERISKLIANYKRKSRIEKVWRGSSAVFVKVMRLFA
jgi:hypothetical protein